MKKLEDKGENVPRRYFLDGVKVKKEKGGGTYHRYLIMKRNGKVMLKQELFS